MTYVIKCKDQYSSTPDDFTKVKKEKGVKEYLRQLAASEVRAPSYWTKFSGPMRIGRAFNMTFRVDVDKPTEKAVRDVVMGTWKGNLVGQGADAAGLHHKAIEIRKVERLELPELYMKYGQERNNICRKGSVRGHLVWEMLQCGKGLIRNSSHVSTFHTMIPLFVHNLWYISSKSKAE